MADRIGEFDVAILGAGPIACATAYNLARRKVTAVVLDREGAGGSSAISGRIGVCPDSPEHYVRLCLRSLERYPALEGEIGAVEYIRSGGLAPALTDADARAGMARAHQHAAAGLDVRWLPRDEALRLEPCLSPEILGAASTPYDGSVNAHLLVRRLVTATRQIGGTFLFRCGHLTVQWRPGGFLIRSGRGEIQATRLVLAPGVDDPDIRRQVEVTLPVRHVHEAMLVTEALPPLLRHTLPSASQKASGEVVLEGPASGGALDTIVALARDATRLLPSLTGARVIRACTGSRAVPADEWPILGAVGENIFIAMAPHEITLCPLAGEILTEIITRRRVPEDIDRFGPERFSAPTAASANRSLRQDLGGTP